MTATPPTEHSSVRLLIVILAVSSFGLLAILSVIFWLSSAFNRDAQAAVRDVVTLSIEDIGERAAYTAHAFAHRDELYKAVHFGLGRAVRDFLAPLATSNGTFDFVIVADAAGQPLQAYFSDPAWAGVDYAPRDVTTALAAAMTRHGPGTEDEVTGIYRVVERFATFAASPILPEEGLAPGAPLPGMLIVGTYLDPLALPVVRDLLEDNDLMLVIGDIYPRSDRNFSLLRNASGQTVGALMWRPHSPGTQILRESAPIMLLAFVVILLSTVLTVKGASRLVEALAREGQIARTDALTGLPNRLGLTHYRLSAPVQTALRAGHLGILYMDLNGFKRLNDMEGHTEGDRALQRTAALLNDSVRSADFVARVGGDEFLCVVTDPDPERVAARIAERIAAKSAVPIVVDGRSYLVRPAIGIAVAGAVDSWDDLVNLADERMYAAKRAARSTADPVAPSSKLAAMPAA